MKRVMFVCKKNSARSQMAEGFANALITTLAAPKIAVTSSGLAASEVNPGAIAAMVVVGIDITQQTSKPLQQFNPQDFDVVISLCGCGVDLPPAWRTSAWFEDWQLPDPAEHPEMFPAVRDQIQLQVRQLISALG